MDGVVEGVAVQIGISGASGSGCWWRVGHVVRSLLRVIMAPARAKPVPTEPQEAQHCD